MTIRMSIPMDEAQAARIEEIAKARAETAGDVLAEAVSSYLDHDAWFVREVETGMAEADQGDLVDYADVAAELRARASIPEPE